MQITDFVVAISCCACCRKVQSAMHAVATGIVMFSLATGLQEADVSNQSVSVCMDGPELLVLL